MKPDRQHRRADARELRARATLYSRADVRIGPMIGVKDLGISYTEVPPGKSACPFHNHHVEDEMFIILEGEGTYRFGAETLSDQGRRRARRAGGRAGDGAPDHQHRHRAAPLLRHIDHVAGGRLRVPGSGKFGVFSRSTRNPYDKSTVRHLDRLGTGLDYWDGEPGAESKDQ